MRRNWHKREVDKERIRLLTSNLGISPLLAHLLINRGIREPMEAERFLNASLFDLLDPYKLRGMKEAVEEIRSVIRRRGKVMLHGDYDVDGITSVALLYEYLRERDVPLCYYLPHRMEEGYGISENALRSAREEGVSLFIAMDCGITAVEEIRALRGEGIRVIIIDHHRPKSDVYPPANAIINPWQRDCDYPEKELTSSGLVFKLLQALIGFQDESLLRGLDLVCLGTVADVASLKGENRVLVKYGLEVLRNTDRIGLRTLINLAGLKIDRLDVRDISYIIAPRLNAVGRVDAPHDAFHLLITDSKQEAEDLAYKLESANKRRQEMESQVMREAKAIMEGEVDFSGTKFIVLWGKGWHPGVLGIVAARICEEFYRPCILLSERDGLLRGSGRSIPELNIFEAVSNCGDILEEYGGHAGACGLSMRLENIEKFSLELNNYAEERLKDLVLLPSLPIDSEIDFVHINEELLKDIETLAPFGPGNPEPLFLTRSARVLSEPKGLGRGFYKIWVKKGKFSYQALFKDNIGILPKQDELIDLVYKPTLDEWEGIKTVTLFLEDFRSSS